MAYAELVEDKPIVVKCLTGDIVTTQQAIVHNIYVPKGCVIHTVKQGSTSYEDRTPFPKFDSMLKKFTKEKILRSVMKYSGSQR